MVMPPAPEPPGPVPVVRAALGEVAWHTEAYAALGVPWQVSPGLAWRTGDSHPFLLAVITISADVTVEQVVSAAARAEGSAVVCDSHDRLDLTPYGFTGKPADPWMIRPPGPFAPHVAATLDGVSMWGAGSSEDVESVGPVVAARLDGAANEGPRTTDDVEAPEPPVAPTLDEVTNQRGTTVDDVELVGPIVAPRLDGVTIRRASTPDDVEAFERTAFVANEDLAGWVPGALHPRDATLDRTDLHLFLAEVDGRPVGTALASVCPTGVTVSGVAVEPSFRRRGIGAALTRAAVEAAPDRPATLSASDLGLGTYRRLGFVELPRPRHWTRRT